MKILFFDTETSGLYPFDNVILQLSYQIVESKDWSTIKTVNHYFNWPLESWRVSSKAIEVNGLTQEYLATKKISDKETALKEFVADKNSVELLVAHNLDFDKKFILAECKEYNIKFAQSGWNNVYDTMKKTTNICCLEKNYGRGYKWPKLIELAQFLSVKVDDLNLHDSSADVELTKRCFIELVKRGYHSIEKQDTGISVQLHVESADDFTFTFFTDESDNISEDFLVSKYGKKSIDDVKQELLQLWTKQNEEERDALKLIHNNIQKLKSAAEFEDELKAISPAKYHRQEFSEPKPTKEAVEAELQEEAKEQIKSVMFWANSSKRRAYVEERLDAKYEKLIKEYDAKKADFDSKEAEKEISFNAEAQKKCEDKKTFLTALLAGEQDAILRSFHQSDIYVYPLSINVVPSLNSSDSVVLDVILPDIADIPQLYGDCLASGKYKIKNLSNPNLREDYAIDVTGLGLYLAYCYTNCAPTINTVKVVGRRRLEDNEHSPVKEAIYAFEISREQICALKGAQYVPYEQITCYPHTMNLSKTFLFKAIDPDVIK